MCQRIQNVFIKECILYVDTDIFIFSLFFNCVYLYWMSLWIINFWYFQVWFQNARAKYRRNLLKQDCSSDKNKQSDNSDASSKNNNNMDRSLSPEFPDLPDIPNSRSPGSFSDLSSTPSLSEFHGQHHITTSDSDANHNSSFGDLFSHVTASMNALV